MTTTQTVEKAKEIILDVKGQDWYDENIERIWIWGAVIYGKQIDYISIKLKIGIRIDFKNTNLNPYLEQIKQAFT